MRVRTHVNPLTYITRMKKIDYSKVLPKNKFTDFEIGFGRAIFARNYAKEHLDRNLIAIEIRKPVVKHVKAELKDTGLDNLYLLHGRAEICLEDTISDGQLDRIFLFHPDPWLKARHNKRRVIQSKFLDLVYKKLKNNGRLYVSTDVEELWNDMKEIIQSNGKFRLIEDKKFWEEEYISYWHEHSEKEKRSLFYATFERV